ncbi:aminotransferase-like domain-containing protein [Legionella hackeliae]|uniref:Putative 2-aminoadipate transaminase n=1 Tax=Legionella hackeliae TaxID=449 RepID=A0A0A8US85_LEGHA|nr:PLP-dependent aminotransferase family protein [Legionella hackeliae]KTD10105.1 aspartate aminotransferase [Legionella hackeliae]CEK09594.1 putative 2-aminoadipate transaminase [Legionella hackeliae]STX49505.1 aspartate aminotransferase [Legionella hackeliae]
MMNERIQPLEIQKYVKLSQRNDVISFAAGLPDLSVMPLEQLKEAYVQLLHENSGSFQYQAPIEALKQKIQKMMASQSVFCNLDEILITNGAQQAIYLTANLFLKPKASLMIEEFVYPGFLQIANMFDLNYLPIPSLFNQGLDLNYLESLLKTNKPLPFLYVVCNGHNPLGITLNTQIRKELAVLAEKYNLIIVEDDPYGYLNFSDEQFLPMRAYTKNAIYIGSFSKTIAPAVRTGWIVAEKNIIQKLQQLKDMNDLYCSNTNHLALNTVLDKYPMDEITYPQKIHYKSKLECMINALEEFIDIPCRYIKPKHGMFIWLEFLSNQFKLEHDRIFHKSNVLYIPESAFAVGKSTGKQAIRLSFAYPTLDQIILGIKKLGDTIQKSAGKNFMMPCEII